MGAPDKSTSAEARSLFLDFLMKREAAPEAEFESFCHEHSRHADALRELYREWHWLEGNLAAPGSSSAILGERLRQRFGPDVDPEVTLAADVESEVPTDPPSQIAPSTSVGDRLRRLSRTARDVGRYAVVGEVGRGGMATIFKIWDAELRRSLAMKVCHPDQDAAARSERDAAASTSRALFRFLEEAQITGQLEHPGVVPVHDLGLGEDGKVFFTMRLIKGRTLSEVFRLIRAPEDKSHWTLTRALDVIIRVCETLAYAHSKAVIHRDLKPSNIMVGKFGEVYVMDWGLARVIGRSDSHDLRVRRDTSQMMTLSKVRTDRIDHASEDPESPLMTMDGAVVGTPAYMPPEQAEGRIDELCQRSDVYSVGAMLYQLLTGQPPYVPHGSKLSPYTILNAVIHGPPEPVPKIAPSVPAELVAICEKAMARRIEDRYASILDMAIDLRAYLEHRVVRAYRTGAVAEFTKWVARNKTVAASIGIALLAALGGLGAVTWVQASAKNEILRMSDITRLRTYEEEAAALYPPYPENVPPMTAWLGRAEELAARLPIHRAELGALEANALPYDESARQTDLATHPDALELAGLEEDRIERRRTMARVAAKEPERTGKIADIEREIAALDETIERRRADLAGRRLSYSFASPEQQWRYDTLRTLVDDLERFADPDPSVGTIADVRERVTFAERLATSMEREHRAAWIGTIAEIAASDRYGGLVIEPQLGLVPIGADPRSGLFEFAHLQTGEIADRRDDGTLELTEETGLVFVLIPGGTFLMGSPGDDPHADLEVECPQHEVTLAPYFLSKYEMTQGQWLRVEHHNPSQYGPDFEIGGHRHDLRHPVELISWEDCRRVLDKLGLALPTEAQWEHAARAGTTTPWYCGAVKESLQGTANLADRFAMENRGLGNWLFESWLDDGYTAHAPVGSFAPNPFGLHDMYGNIWEYTRDRYGLYDEVPVLPRTGERDVKGRATTSRTIRGGAFNSPAAVARSAQRSGPQPNKNHDSMGVRPARRIVPTPETE